MAQLPVHPPEWIDSAPTIATSTVRIDAPPSAVWAHIADHASWPTWFRALDDVTPIGSGAGVGGGRSVTVGKMTLDEEFTAWDVDEHFAFAVTRSPLPIFAGLAESVRLEPTGDRSCTVTYRQGVQGRAGLGWLAGIVGRRLETQTRAALSNLQRLVEAGD